MRFQLFQFTVYNFFIERFLLAYILFKVFLTVLGKYSVCLCIIYSWYLMFGRISSDCAIRRVTLAVFFTARVL